MTRSSSLRARSILVATSMVAAGSVSAQAQLELNTTANGGQNIVAQLGSSLVGGTSPPLIFGQPPSPGLTVRTQPVVLCANLSDASANPLKQVVLDPNGYFEPLSLANQAFDRDAGNLFYGEGAFLRATMPTNFSTTAYIQAGSQLVFDVQNAEAYCFAVPVVDTPPAWSICATVEDQDSLFGDGLELQPQGSLLMSAASVREGVDLNYQYVLRAVGGTVHNVQFREQFPYFVVGETGQPKFGKSLQLQENWHCEASQGARCDQRGRVLDGAGYAHLEGGSIPPGGCLKITTGRYLRLDGVEATNPFSGRLHAGAVYTTTPGAQTGPVQGHVSLRHAMAQ